MIIDITMDIKFIKTLCLSVATSDQFVSNIVPLGHMSVHKEQCFADCVQIHQLDYSWDQINRCCKYPIELTLYEHRCVGVMTYLM